MPSFGNPHDPAHPTTSVESRRALRAMLLHARAALPDRVAHDGALAHHLGGLLHALPVRCLAAYWPTQAEFDRARRAGSLAGGRHGAPRAAARGD
ncbi:hypothetical protein C2U35_10175 [Ralstonia solanacearum]|nr:hypothetical protein C2U35_10175 [Ralstonia solanacearum]